MASLKDIAQACGVSVSTVSRALNDSPEIGDDTKQRIRNAAAAMGYSLRGRGGRDAPEWNTVGIIVPEIISDYYARIVHCAKTLLAQRQFSSIVKITDFSADELVDAIQTMQRIRVKCLLIVMDDEEIVSERILRAIHTSRLPVMLITSKYYPLLDFDCIHLDEYSGIIMAVRHLQSRGYQRIGFIGEPMTANRLTAFKQAMKFQGLEPACICTGPERGELGGYLRMKELLRRPDQPDAVFCSYDLMAIGALHALRESDRSIAVMGFDDIAAARYIEGGITTVANPYEDMLSIAVRVLTTRLHNPDGPCQQITLQPKLIHRATT